SLSPSGGVSLGCHGQHQGVRFMLNKERRHFPPLDSEGLEAEFSNSKVSREHGGSYSCSYHSTSEPVAVSYPSDPMELVVRDPSLPRPSISLSVTWVTTPGSDVTIRCQGQRQDVSFFLHKVGDLNPQRHMDPAGARAEFRIPTVAREHGGSYSCSYRPRSEPFISSQPSDPVQLVVAEPSYPKPNISLSPSGGVSLGGAVTVRCRGQRRGMRFVLNKERSHFPPVDSVGLDAEFSNSIVRREDGGSYSCSYHSRSEPFAVSYPSDPVELVVRDPSLPRPSISLSVTWVTTPGANVTIRCQGQRRNVRFFLHKAGDLNPQQHMDPAGAGAEFRIPTVGRQHGGNYSCSYRPRSEPFVSSEPSDPVQLVIAEPSYPKPNISLSPSGGVSLGGAVTVRCRGQRRGMRFVLNKERSHFPPVDSVGLEAEFSNSIVRREDGGSYSCSYHSRSEPFAVSYPSDPVELVVRDPSLPRPSISLSVTWVTTPGSDVTIRCQGQRQDVSFFLHKAGDLNPQRHMDPAGARAEFRIPTVAREHGGSYSCSYRPRSEPFISSQPSDPVQLVVADEGPGSTSPLPSGPPEGESKSGLTWPVIAGVSAAAVGLLLLLLVACVCFRKTRARKGAAPRPSSTSPFGVLKAPAQQDPVYASIDEGKETQTLVSVPCSPPWGLTPNPDPHGPHSPYLAHSVLWGGGWVAGRGLWDRSWDCRGVFEPDPSADGLTYAELDGQALQAKRGDPAPAPEPAQPSMYAAINVSQGAPQFGLEVADKPSDGKKGAERITGFLGLQLLVQFLIPQFRSHSGLRLEGSYPKPFISVSPAGVIPVGGNVTIWCWHQPLGMRFLLYKAEDGNLLTYTDPAGSEAEFPITSARRENGGSYTCCYHDKRGIYSEYSDPVQIIVAELSSPKPSNSLSPSGGVALGEARTIRRWGQCRGLEFVLYKAGARNTAVRDGDSAGVKFPIPKVTRADRGSYTCYYPPDSDPDSCSEPSDPVELVVAEPSYPKPNISLSPSGGVSLGGAVTVRCRGQRRGMRFVLNKERSHFPPVDSVGLEAEFSNSIVRREDGGSYSCSYHSRSEPFAVSYPSDPVELVVRDPSLPRPSISLSVTWVTTPGSDVTIRCQGQRQDVSFFLHKAGDLNPQRHMDPAGARAEFRIPTVAREHGGSYSCSYRPRSEPFISSQPSDPVQLVVADEGPGSTSPLPSGPPEGESKSGLTWPVIAGVSAAAVGLLLLLLVACVCFRKTRARKGAAPRPSSTSPFGVLKAPAQQDPVYASIDEGKETQTLVSVPCSPPWGLTPNPDPHGPHSPYLAHSVLWGGGWVAGRGLWDRSWDCRGVFEPDPSADGLTYAELDGQALQAKRGDPAPAPEPAQPSMYAAINVSQGAPQFGLEVADKPSDGKKGAERITGFLGLQLLVQFLIPQFRSHSGLRLEGSYPKPFISVSPAGVIPVGGNVTIWCWHQPLGMRFLLYKAEDGNLLTYTDPAGSEAEFPITSARRENGGSYTCCYHDKRGIYSEYSDPVQIIVAELSSPKPSNSLSPSGGVALGEARTIRRWGQCRGLEFVLYKAGARNTAVRDGDSAGVKFPIPKVTRADRGSYTCYYPPDSDPDSCSEPSDPVELVVAEPSYPKPNISLSPSGGVSLGGAVTVRCRGQRRGMRFVLNKERSHFPPVDSVGLEAEFSNSIVRREDGGSYSCSYHSRSEPFAVSYPSDPVELVVRDPSLPRPSISLSVTWVTTPGSDVTIRCQGQRQDVSFFLHKAGDLNPQRHMDPAGARAEFRIPTVAREHGGSYSCSYRPRSEPFISSQPSDPVQLVVADEGPGSTSPLPSGPPEGESESGLTWPVIAGVSTAAVGLLLLLLVAFVCFRKTRASECPAQRGKG
ncbi:uncharacterized protein RBU57_017330, partial [Macrochelys suwanniensis]